MVRTYQSQKIDPQAHYPCPCHRSGGLTPITLTEAFGCDHCQHIFVLQQDGYVMEQLSTHYPYKRAWRWTGQGWRLDRTSLGLSQALLLLGIALGLIVFSLTVVALQSPQGVRAMAHLLMIMGGVLFLGLVLWLASQR